jgi:thiol-disulfide isomerase/thioredoxin
MRNSTFPILLTCLLLTTSCYESKTDGDEEASNDNEEEVEEIDPDLDSDEDGIPDVEEAELGTDPENPDSDDDGYLDSWEVEVGSDPMDDESVIYQGDWPYNPDKDDYDAPDIEDGVLEVGAMMANYTLMDQFGDMVNLYDFAGQGVPIMIDISATWCPPCNSIASWLSGDDYDGWGSSYTNITGMIENGDVYWITVLGENDIGRVPDQATLEGWADDYPDPHIPVMADDENKSFAGTYLGGGWPTLFLLDEDMTIITVPTDANYWQALDDLDAMGN